MLKKYYLFLYILTGLLFGQNPVSVPLHQPVYNFLERMEALGVTGNQLNGALPLSRGRVATLLQVVAHNRIDLTAIDQRRLDDFLLDFRRELQSDQNYQRVEKGSTWYSTLASWQNLKKDFFDALRQKYPEEENHLFLWETGDSSFYMDYRQVFTYDSRSDGPARNANEQTYLFRGGIGNFGYQWQISTQAVRGDMAYRVQDPLLKNTFIQDSENGKTTYADRTGGELSVHFRAFDFAFAQQPLSWGPGESGKLILSDWAEQYPYISINKNWGWGRFTMIHAKLQSFLQSTLDDGTRIYPDKWLAAHRLEISPFANFSFGLNETFIYGNRYADWSYLFPLNFYRAVQHKLRDRDNAAISLDAEWMPVNGIKLYGALFLDDMKFDSLGGHWYGNKQAVQAGINWYDPFGWANARVTAEYVAIMPWVYTHKFAINDYTSDNRSLGYWAGPNSEVVFWEIKKDLHARLMTGVRWQKLRKGHNLPNANIGGDILLGHNTLLGDQIEPRRKRNFLEGELETRQDATLFVRYELFNDLYLSGSYIFTHRHFKSIDENYNSLHFGFLFNY